MASLLVELVTIPTENPPGTNHRACAEFLETRLRECGLECQRLQPAELAANSEQDADVPVSLLATCGRGDRTLYFHGHYDVVPTQSPEQFQPVRKDHFLFGRGSCDMKGGIVAMLYAILALRETGVKLDGRLALALVPDEETGGARGSAWLAQQGLLGKAGIGMLTAEPTSGVVWNANRGAITLRVQVLGKSAHVGLQHQGENGFERMHRVVERLLDLKREVEQRKTASNTGAEQARNSILMLGGQSGGGTNFNVVPEKCWLTLDRRINPEEDLETEKGHLLAVLEQCQRDGIPLQWEILQEGRSAASREDERLVQSMPAYAYGPGLLSVAHGPNEYVDLRKVTDCAAIYALAAIETLKK